MEKKNTNNKTLNKRIILLLIAVIYLLGVFSSNLYLVKEQNHICDNDHCYICDTITTIKDTLNSQYLIVPVIISGIFIAFLLIRKILFVFKNIQNKSLIELKVKMLN